MIKFRQKEYSLGITKTLATLERATGKGKLSSARKAINSQDKILKGVLKTKQTLQKGIYNPGKVLNKGIEETIKNPVSTAGIVAGRVTDITNPESIIIPKTAIAIGIGNKVIPEKGRKYLSRQASKYKNSKIAKSIENSIPDLPTLSKIIGSGLGIS